MTYTLSMVQKKIIYRLIRPKLSKVVISKQAWDTSWGIPNFWQNFAFISFRVFYIFTGVWSKGPTPVRERVSKMKSICIPQIFYEDSEFINHSRQKTSFLCFFIIWNFKIVKLLAFLSHRDYEQNTYFWKTPVW
jgi:hypothetical protein